MSVCLSARIAYLRNNNVSKLHQISRARYLVVARSFSDGVAIRYVLPVTLWMTSLLHIMAGI